MNFGIPWSIDLKARYFDGNDSTASRVLPIDSHINGKVVVGFQIEYTRIVYDNIGGICGIYEMK
jgi:hypothetical protein